MIAGVKQLLGHRVAACHILLLFGGKTAGILVGLIFLPMYQRLLGAEEFGLVAVVLSLQALLTMMDLGMSTMVSRDAATSGNALATHWLLMAAEGSLSGFYLVLAGTAALAMAAGLFNSIGIVSVMTALILLWVLVLQNLYFSVLLAKRSYAIASMTQIIGVLMRALATAYVLYFVAATLEAFLLTQALFGIAHAVLTKHFCNTALHAASLNRTKRPSMRDCIALARQGTSLIAFSAAGAAVTQLDKPLVSALVSAADLAPYFLATTVCMVPISVLAGPVSQFYHPRVLAAIADAGQSQGHGAIRQYISVILLATCLPALILWLGRDTFMALWLGPGPMTHAVASYVAILLPGFAIGALGFFPYSLLIAAKDDRFQALASIALTIVTLGAAAWGAWNGSVRLVCWIYAVYHAASTVVSWTRATRLPKIAQAATYSLGLAVRAVSVTLVCGGILNQFIQ